MNNIAPGRPLLLGTENLDGTVTGVTSGQSQAIPVAGAGLVTIYLRSVGVTSGGTIVVEEADWGPLEPPYSGTWSTITSVAANSFSGGAQVALRIANSAAANIRVRISSAITGGGSILATGRTQTGG